MTTAINAAKEPNAIHFSAFPRNKGGQFKKEEEEGEERKEGRKGEGERKKKEKK